MENGLNKLEFSNHNESTEEEWHEKEIYPEVQEIINENPKLKEAIDHYKENCDKYTLGHVFGTTNKVVIISDYLDLDPEDREVFVQASLLHDIGKADKEITKIIKSEKNHLNTEETNTIKKHVRKSIGYAKDINMPEEVLQIIGAHHEENNGKSYPRKKNIEDNFNREERRKEPNETTQKMIHTFSIIDRLDALYHQRSYKNTCSAQECYKILKEEFPTEEDHKIIDLLLMDEDLKKRM